MLPVEEKLFALADKALRNEPLTKDELLTVLNLEDELVPLAVYLAHRVKRRFFGNALEFCSIINAKSGACEEDCAFCAQSKHYKAPVTVYGLVPEHELIEGARRAVQMGAERYCVVLSGKQASKEEVEQISRAVEKIKREMPQLRVCVSAGTLDAESLRRLKTAGVERINHNLESARSFFPKIVSTHRWEERYETVKRVKEAGLEVCSGGIFGMGESNEERAELALTLRELEVPSVPLNFLMPIEGTPLENAPGVEPLEALKVIAAFRFALPTATLRLCGGREKTLRDFHGMAVLMVNALMVGGYLTRAGRDVRKDYQLLKDLKLSK
ncbi:MAG: biotin synthase BioB [Aquificae bacterium]|nr:biotin synthase BioB [Aquificota bacterium]